MSEAKAYVALLERLGGMLGYLELERLREDLEELKRAKGGPSLGFDQSRIPPESRIQWGQGLKAD
ncbi:hypothetical protein [Tropicimonas sp. IMCC6043]|uniref:hypothetical protein n=1 Tax=Tropicimonas sp. IMCC6043 TaxID=2510645 RepID=UPI00101C626C|nr:hypothetical protein [Tropicimonas sp. IMCC6043]RYH05824.1 hypothetical protein EU800_25830 [Tropicimonas sp. IMCC6043]